MRPDNTQPIKAFSFLLRPVQEAISSITKFIYLCILCDNSSEVTKTSPSC